jgi:methoxymalonate biosynthesis acyl carrier protein
MTTDEIKNNLKLFLSKYFQNYSLADDEDMFSLGMVNSMFAMQLVLFVEQTFGIVIENEDLDLENFKTINALTALVERKKSNG